MRSVAPLEHPGTFDDARLGQVEAEPPAPCVASFTVASFNVCTMKEEQEGVRSRGCAGRAAVLRRQVRDEKILFAGIQEA
eukprot:15059664-Heterocapsa_arctica.AAC.1